MAPPNLGSASLAPSAVPLLVFHSMRSSLFWLFCFALTACGVFERVPRLGGSSSSIGQSETEGDEGDNEGNPGPGNGQGGGEINPGEPGNRGPDLCEGQRRLAQGDRQLGQGPGELLLVEIVSLEPDPPREGLNWVDFGAAVVRNGAVLMPDEATRCHFYLKNLGLAGGTVDDGCVMEPNHEEYELNGYGIVPGYTARLLAPSPRPTIYGLRIEALDGGTVTSFVEFETCVAD